jgi:hypothetical protein
MFPPVDFVVNAAGWAAFNYTVSGMGARKIASAVVARRIKYERTGKMCRCTSDRGFLRMGGGGSNDDIGSTTPVSITVLSVTPMRAGKRFAIAAVAIDIDGVLIEIHGPMQDEPFRSVFQHRADGASIRRFIVDLIDRLIKRTGVDADFPRMTDTKGTTSAHHYNRIKTDFDRLSYCRGSHLFNLRLSGLNFSKELPWKWTEATGNHIGCPYWR